MLSNIDVIDEMAPCDRYTVKNTMCKLMHAADCCW